MPHFFQNKILRIVSYLILMQSVVIIFTLPAYARSAELNINISQQAEIDRLIFDWNRMIGYTAAREGNRLILTFEARALPTPTIPSLENVRNIRSIRLVRETERQSVFEITLAEEAQYRDYRAIRSIILDTYGGTPSTVSQPETTASSNTRPQQSPPTPTPPPLPEAPPVPLSSQPETMPEITAAPVETVTETEITVPTSSMQTLAENDNIQINGSSENAELPPLPNQPTIITISTIEPTAIAVFERFGFLWIILDSARGTIEPERFGPVTNELGQADIYNINRGVAYRFRMPDRHHISISKRSLAWQVTLSPDVQPAFSSTTLDTVYDRNNENPRLVQKFERAGSVLEITDPATGENILVVPSTSATQRLETPFRNSDIDVLKTSIGFAAVPKRNDITLDLINDTVTLSRPDGFTVSSPAARFMQVDPFADVGNGEENRLFNLRSWGRGGISAFVGHRQRLQDQIANIEDPNDRANGIFQLALLYFANGFGDEALGLLEIVETEDTDEDLKNRLSFLAIRGASKAMAGRYEESINDLGTAALQNQPEARLWRAYAAAASERWRLAETLFPQDTGLLNGYPEKLAIPMTLYMAESALRSADPGRAARLLETLDAYGDRLPIRHRTAKSYLQGEMFRQNNQPGKALEIWDDTIKNRDRLYQTKARLARTLLQWQQNEITAEEALDRLERMRFAWRDDALETQILHSIGLLRVVNGRYYDGLTQLKNAIRLAEQRREDTEPLTRDMLRIFRDLFVDGQAQKIPALEAISIYSEFSELLPSGQDGVAAALNFSDHLIEMDLLDRAAQNLETLISSGSIDGEAVTRTGARLASIYLLNAAPNEAISVLQRTGRSDIPEDLREERQLLRSRALSQMDMTDDAIRALDGLSGENAARLRADIYWRAAEWTAAAEWLETLIPSPATADITTAQAEYILNTAVAYKLAGNDQALADLKRSYSAQMNRTRFGNSFAVITRPAGETRLSDRETMLNIAGEVDIFRGFLDNYRGSDLQNAENGDE